MTFRRLAAIHRWRPPKNDPDCRLSFGLSKRLGIGLIWEDGIWINILRLAAGLDLNDFGLRLPGIGRPASLSMR
jgi:hypothetical protein